MFFKLKRKENSMENQSKNKARIYNLIIVDESGSMSYLREATLSGVNETINTIRQAQKDFADTQEHFLTLVTFDSGTNKEDVRTLIDCEPIGQVKDFKKYCPNGCTPLYDAMGQSITRLRERIKEDADASAVVTVLTDGMENSSREWTAQALRQLIEQLKEEGWSFSYMGSAHDVKSVTDLLAIDNAIEFSHDVKGTANTWERERSAKRAFYEKMNCMMHEDGLSKEERIIRKRQYAREYYRPRVTPHFIDHLEANEIFVFGSNAQGQHAGGAAAQAMAQFGAVWGQGEGLQGQSYAIPSMEGLDSLREAVERFIQFADRHRELRFLVTRIGCGIAGYTEEQVASLFTHCIKLENVTLPASFWKVLGITNFLNEELGMKKEE